MRYHSTQPWPYPSSLMIGLIAEVENDDAVPDMIELDEVRWFTREETRAMLRGEIADANAPGALAIAHQLIRAWSRKARSALGQLALCGTGRRRTRPAPRSGR